MYDTINQITKEDLTILKQEPTLDEYQHISGKSAFYPGKGTFIGQWYCVTKLNGEAGELAEKYGKIVRDDGIMHEHTDEGAGVVYCNFVQISTNKREALALELGDCLWYVARLAHELGYTLEEVALMNLEKLYSRTVKGTLQGSGDNR